ncbi:Hsp33 family molecular chaperone HslO [Roseburia sp. BX0805]|uniref:33 kDa chaperonin n=1 Tax=Roseburia yibonii TaxID=2763063 RepID=A0ABR7IC32_9FIRM|nr:Hsp33 family molecular chaperone HslO [Roseburia yibonii]MBC5754490.1 Hsp33 family molecular chaperone HslO [Roseburia yibonii]
MADYMIRATAAEGQIRAFAVTSKELVEEARKRHNTSPIVTAALGRLMSGAVMMGSMMKGEKDLLTIRVNGDGPMRGMTVTADAAGNVKGYPFVPDVVLPANALGKLDVAGAIGAGNMSVIKDMGLKEPYIGQTALQTGEIAEDLTYYFAVSEQVPSAVGLGVLMNKENTVEQAGGFIIQLMPFAEEEVIEKLEKKVAEVTSVTSLLAQGYNPEMILQKLLGNLGLEITENMPVRFYCGCSKERVTKALASISRAELDEIIKDGKPIEVNCDFCNMHYTFDIDELKEIGK